MVLSQYNATTAVLIEDIYEIAEGDRRKYLAPSSVTQVAMRTSILAIGVQDYMGTEDKESKAREPFKLSKFGLSRRRAMHAPRG